MPYTAIAEPRRHDSPYHPEGEMADKFNHEVKELATHTWPFLL